jgi:hypothetical protein
MLITRIINLVKIRKKLKGKQLRSSLPKDYKKLKRCLLMDIIGMFTAWVPFLNLIWAPISSLISLKMFGTTFKGKMAAMIDLAEELFSFSSIFPTFTLFWLYESFIE